jgi:hypothetical protein
MLAFSCDFSNDPKSLREASFKKRHGEKNSDEKSHLIIIIQAYHPKTQKRTNTYRNPSFDSLFCFVSSVHPKHQRVGKIKSVLFSFVLSILV